MIIRVPLSMLVMTTGRLGDIRDDEDVITDFSEHYRSYTILTATAITHNK